MTTNMHHSAKKFMRVSVVVVAIALCASCTREEVPQVYYNEDLDSAEDSKWEDTPQTPVHQAPAEVSDTNDLRTADHDGTNLIITTPSGQFQMEVGTNITPPMALLTDLPINDKAQLVNCLTGPDAIFATYATQQTEEEAFEFYKTEIQQLGWEFQGAFELGGRQMMTAFKGKHRLTITFQDSAEERVFHIMLSQRREDPPGTRREPPAYHAPDDPSAPAPPPQPLR